MRLENNTLIISERNLLSLLTKLYTEGSACELEGGIDCPMNIRAEKDDVHYSGRPYPPGPMHPVTEGVLDAIRRFTEGVAL